MKIYVALLERGHKLPLNFFWAYKYSVSMEIKPDRKSSIEIFLIDDPE